MANPTFTLSNFTAAVLQLGRAEVFYSTAWGASTSTDLNLSHLGVTEDPIQVEVNEEFSVLTLPEHTGPAPLEAYMSGAAPRLPFSLVDASTSVWSIMRSAGNPGLGYQRRRSVTEYTVALFPTELFLTSTGEVAVLFNGTGWSIGGSTTKTAEQQRLLKTTCWLWRGHFETSLPLYSHDEGGKAKMEVAFVPMQDFRFPDGQQIATVGDPADYGIDIKPSTA